MREKFTFKIRADGGFYNDSSPANEALDFPRARSIKVLVNAFVGSKLGTKDDNV